MCNEYLLALLCDCRLRLRFSQLRTVDIVEMTENISPAFIIYGIHTNQHNQSFAQNPAVFSSLWRYCACVRVCCKRMADDEGDIELAQHGGDHGDEHDGHDHDASEPRLTMKLPKVHWQDCLFKKAVI